MADSSRLEDLRRRIHKDPASIAFAQLAEEYRRAGQFDEAVATCRTGLEVHPSYTSARVTLGRALLALARYDQAQTELERVLVAAPENLAAMRTLAEVLERRGHLPQARARYRAALAFAPNDPNLLRRLQALAPHEAPTSESVAPPTAGEPLVTAQAPMTTPIGIRVELQIPTTGDPTSAAQAAAPRETSPETTDASLAVLSGAVVDMPAAPVSRLTDETQLVGSNVAVPELSKTPPENAVGPQSDAIGGTLEDASQARAHRTIAALEQWLAAIHVARAERST